MELSLESKKQILTAIMLHSATVAKKVATQPKWIVDGKLNATCFINDVEIPAETIEDYFEDVFDRIEKHHREKYDADNLDNLIEEKAKQLLREHADTALEQLSDLQHKLENIEDVLTPT